MKFFIAGYPRAWHKNTYLVQNVPFNVVGAVDWLKSGSNTVNLQGMPVSSSPVNPASSSVAGAVTTPRTVAFGPGVRVITPVTYKIKTIRGIITPVTYKIKTIRGIITPVTYKIKTIWCHPTPHLKVSPLLSQQLLLVLLLNDLVKLAHVFVLSLILMYQPGYVTWVCKAR